MVIISQYTSVSKQHIVHLKFTWCYMLNLFKKKKFGNKCRDILIYKLSIYSSLPLLVNNVFFLHLNWKITYTFSQEKENALEIENYLGFKNQSTWYFEIQKHFALQNSMHLPCVITKKIWKNTWYIRINFSQPPDLEKGKEKLKNFPYRCIPGAASSSELRWGSCLKIQVSVRDSREEVTCAWFSMCDLKRWQVFCVFLVLACLGAVAED